MRLTRIYLAQPLQVGHTAFLDEKTSHYVQHVLRLKVGHPLIVFDGKGKECAAEIVACQKSVQLLIQEVMPSLPESPLHIHLGQAISRGEKMDYTLQKSVELGIKEITPLFTERCGVKLSGERLSHKLTHWEKIIAGACEQSGRSYVPHLHPPVSLSTWLQQPLEGHKVLLHPHAAKRLKDVSLASQSVCLLVGSEGGFSEDEVTFAKQGGFESVSLGPRVLRTETAALAAIAALQCIWGDMG